MAQQETLAQIPGVFYRRPNPTSPPFVEEGQQVNSGDTICLIEVMKTFHEVKAGISGKLIKFLVENEDVVMAGQPIASIEVG
jgi:acetyl-CoA carboxylase biotin carboxyl carrier protein